MTLSNKQHNIIRHNGTQYIDKHNSIIQYDDTQYIDITITIFIIKTLSVMKNA